MPFGLSPDQAIIFSLLIAVFGLLIWGRWRYDLIAFGALVVALLTGVVPVDKAFSGFGHPATVIVALVLILSRGLSNAGVIELASRWIVGSGRSLIAHIGLMSGVSAALSAMMNNVAALALLMPIDLEAAAKAKRSAALTLMPLSFATILGGMVTLIGTPPNIIVASFRADALGSPFGMFDFAPVGGVTAIAGVLFVALIGWRLLPAARSKQEAPQDLFKLENYIAELTVGEDSESAGKKLSELKESLAESEAEILGLLRNGRRFAARAATKIKPGDILVLQGGPDAIEKAAGTLNLDYGEDAAQPERLKDDEMELLEVVVPSGSRAERRSAQSLGLRWRHGVTLLGVAREGKPFRERLRRLTLQAGDVLLLLAPQQQHSAVLNWLGSLPLASRGLRMMQREKAGLAIAAFAIAIAAASFGLVYLPVALAAVAVLYAFLRIVPPSQLYESVEWPVIVLLGAMIPIGQALESTGGTALLADGLVALSWGYPPVVALALLMIVTMTLSDVINNTATAVIAAPIALGTAKSLDVNPDAFLMAVAVAASCAFLTPIGHKNNTIILGPGGYRFGDYWRMGLPLEILVIAVSLPMILLVWPL
ncbi:MAG: SLC13 family permease [Rhodovibrionaceae bacterium]